MFVQDIAECMLILQRFLNILIRVQLSVRKIHFTKMESTILFIRKQNLIIETGFLKEC